MIARHWRDSLNIITLMLLFVLAVGCSKDPTEEEILEKAIEHQRWDEYDDALASYQLLIKQFPKSPNVPEALYAMGIIYEKKKDFTKAVAAFKRLADEHPDHPTASSAAYVRAVLLGSELKDPDGAQKAYEEFLKRYPNALMAASARAELESLKTMTRKKK